MNIKSIRLIKTWLYEYLSDAEKETHRAMMISGKFNIEKEGELWIEFSQVIKESG